MSLAYTNGWLALSMRSHRMLAMVTSLIGSPCFGEGPSGWIPLTFDQLPVT